jgi:opacity protein-like surface antigen
MTEDIDVALLIGPSFYGVKQDFIQTVEAREGAPPFNTVSIGSVTRVEQSERAVAFTAGIDAQYRVTPRYGVGVFFRYSGASVDMPLVGGGTVTVDAGGVQLGGGLRVRF